MSHEPILKSERIEAALVAALEEGRVEPFFDAVERSSGMPGPRPHLELLRALGARLAAAGGPGEELAEALLDQKKLCLYWVGCEFLAARAAAGRMKAFDRLHDLADEVDHERRAAVIEALAHALSHRPDALAAQLSTFTDGFLHAHVALEALSRREVTTRLSSSEALLARLGEAFDLADDAPRSADRSQGLRLLRAGLPGQIARIAPRFGEVVPWLEERTSRKRPETREIVAESIGALRKVLGEAEADRLRGMLEATAKAPRDPSRIVKGTRKRSRGR